MSRSRLGLEAERLGSRLGLGHEGLVSIPACNQRHYLLAQLKRQNQDILALDSVFKAIVVNKILYALPVYFGYLTQGQKLVLQRVFKRAYRSGLTLCECDVEEAQCIS